MIWLLLALFVPGGLNQGISVDIPSSFTYNVVHPCDGTNISVVNPSWTQGHLKQYNLLIVTPPSVLDLAVKFESQVSLKVIKPGRAIYVTSYDTFSLGFYLKFASKSQDYEVLNCTIIVPNRSKMPYVRSIYLNNKEELCIHPKTGYFKKNYNAPYSVPSTTPNVLEEITNVPVFSSTMANENNNREQPNNVPIITEEKNKDNDYTTIRNTLVLPSGSNDAQPEDIRPSQGETCGRKKLTQTPLIVNGQSAKFGYWPWHVAIFRTEQFNQKYICGGTLLSKTLVLTAAHCATIQGNAVIPESLSVGLGKLYLFGKDVRVQERDVYRVIIHPTFRPFTLDNDIALLKLKSEVVYNDYVQPACLWYEQAIRKLPNDLIFGTVVGWGFDNQDSITYTLQQITIPLVPELTCLKSNPTFFHMQLRNNKKFCAGFANGTSVCNGDSGGGLMIFVTETPGGTTSGAWHVRGIVSASPSKPDTNVCDPDQYTIFTDVEKFRDWVLEYMN